MIAKRRLIVTFFILCFVLHLAGALLFLAAAAPPAHSLFTDAASGGVDYAANREGSDWHIETGDLYQCAECST